ncbi:MAG: ribonuclease P protein component [Gammaproteobacteria bacterium]|nr:ribonuclease P protein component [Gammaproteobacteria bacterium]
MQDSFPRSVRILKPADYKRVFQRSQRSVDQQFMVLYRKNQQGHARLGMAIAKKNHKRAVDRNLIKRLVRESFRLHQEQLPAVDLVVLSRRSLLTNKRHLIHSSIADHWQRIAKRLQSA